MRILQVPLAGKVTLKTRPVTSRPMLSALQTQPTLWPLLVAAGTSRLWRPSSRIPVRSAAVPLFSDQLFVVVHLYADFTSQGASHACVDICLHAHTQMHMYTHTKTHMHTKHAHAHTHTHTHTHAHANACSRTHVNKHTHSQQSLSLGSADYKMYRSPHDLHRFSKKGATSEGDETDGDCFGNPKEKKLCCCSICGTFCFVTLDIIALCLLM